MALDGIDISGWQGGIDTAAIPGDFVIVKRTQGLRLCNNHFSAQIGGAERSGKLLGIYHYAEGGNATAEADAFVDSVADYIGKAVLCLDWEGQDNQIFRSGRDGAWCREWCKRVIDRTGVRPLIYVSSSCISLVSSVAKALDCGLWVAQYASMGIVNGYQAKPWNEGRYSCVMRQYTSSLRLPGYRGNLDGDKFYGDRAAWKAYCNPRKTTSGKSVDELAGEVITGKWGNGSDRKRRLEAAGYDYGAVQDAVNKLCSRKSVDELAREVIAGKWGNGSDRRKRLTEAGYDYDAVRNRVNQLL